MSSSHRFSRRLSALGLRSSITIGTLRGAAGGGSAAASSSRARAAPPAPPAAVAACRRRQAARPRLSSSSCSSSPRPKPPLLPAGRGRPCLPCRPCHRARRRRRRCCRARAAAPARGRRWRPRRRPSCPASCPAPPRHPRPRHRRPRGGVDAAPKGDDVGADLEREIVVRVELRRRRHVEVDVVHHLRAVEHRVEAVRRRPRGCRPPSSGHPR